MTDRKRITRNVKIWIVAIALLIVGGYATFQARNFVEGPLISVESPHNGIAVSEALIEIKGTAKNLSYLTLNGDKIFTDESGAFSEKTLLSPGYNIVTLRAQDRFGRTAETRLQITYK